MLEMMQPDYRYVGDVQGNYVHESIIAAALQGNHSAVLINKDVLVRLHQIASQ